MNKLILPFALLSSLLTTNAAPIYFPTTDSWCDIVQVEINYTTARTAAEATSYLGRTGRLATINSQEENDFLVNSVMPLTGQGFWLGATQTGGGYEPSDGWGWTTGEPWSYTNWAAGEPNNSGGGHEDFLEIYPSGGFGKWNDLREDATYYTACYLIEYAPVPEPNSFALIGLGTAVLFVWRRNDSPRES